MITSERVTVQEIIADIGGILQKVSYLLDDHEQRLQLIERLDLKIELELLRRRIGMIAEQKKQAEALQTFKNLCNSLGISDLELNQS